MKLPKADDLILIYLPLVYICIAAEFFFSKWKGEKNYTLTGFIQNFNITAGQMILHAFTVLLYSYPYQALYNLRLTEMEITFVSLIAIYISIDFIHYWFHRFSHEINFLWAIHLVHHASNDYNLSTSGRTPWLKSLAIFPCYMIYPLIGIPYEGFLFILLLTHLAQFWVHTNIVPQIPLLDYFLVNPSFHRAHHGTEKKYLNINYSEVFAFWDHFFGTYQKEEERPTYGLTAKTNINRPFFQNVYYYLFLYRVGCLSHRYRDRFLIFIKPIGWKPEDVTSKQLRTIQADMEGEVNLSSIQRKRNVWLLFVPIYLGTGAFFLVWGKENAFLSASILTLVILLLMEIQGYLIDRDLKQIS